MQMYMIVPPLNPWEKPADQIMIKMGVSTISSTAGEAWRKHTRGDMSKVQHWFNRGYRLRRVNVELLPEGASEAILRAMQSQEPRP